LRCEQALLPAQGCSRLFKAVVAHTASNILLCLYQHLLCLDLVARNLHSFYGDCNRLGNSHAESLMVCIRKRLEDVERGRQDRCNVMCLRLQSLPSRLQGLHMACYRTQEQVSLIAFPQQLTLSIKC